MKSVNALLSKGVTHISPFPGDVMPVHKSVGPNEKPKGITKESVSPGDGRPGKFRCR